MTDTDDSVGRIERHMLLSQTIGAPIEGIPTHAVEIIAMVQPYLVHNTTPREAGIVMAAVYLYFAAVLIGENDDDSGMERVKELLEVAQYIVADITIDDSEEG